MAPDLIPLLDAWAALAPAEVYVISESYVLVDIGVPGLERLGPRPPFVAHVTRPSLRRETQRTRAALYAVEAHARRALVEAGCTVETSSVPFPRREHHARALCAGGTVVESGAWATAAEALVYVRVAVLEGE